VRLLAGVAALRGRVFLLIAAWFLLSTGLLPGHGSYHERIDYLTGEVQKNPSDPLLRFELANLLGQHGDFELALENLDRVDALAPGKFLTDSLRGEVWFGAGEFAKAKEALDRQLVSHPENPRALLLRARVEQKVGQEQASLSDYREALKRTPAPEPDLFQEVANALAEHGHAQEAVGVLAAGIEKLGKIPSLILRAIDLEIKTGNFEGALKRIDDARRSAVRPEPWMARRCAVLAQAGRIDESRAAWEELEKHLASLPDQERNSHAMVNLAEETRQALAALEAKEKR
jgi:tetratricopeptide (TPR) repeat protein